LSPAVGAAPPAGRYPVRRRAADVRDRARTHGLPDPSDAGRAESRAGPGDGEAHLREPPQDQCPGTHGAPGRAERPPVPPPLAPGLRPGERADRAPGLARRAPPECPHQAGVSRALIARRARPGKSGKSAGSCLTMNEYAHRWWETRGGPVNPGLIVF